MPRSILKKCDFPNFFLFFDFFFFTSEYHLIPQPMEDMYLFLFIGIVATIGAIFGLVRILESNKNQHS